MVELIAGLGIQLLDLLYTQPTEITHSMAQVNIMFLVTGLFGSMSGKDQTTTDLVDIIVELSVEIKSGRDAMCLVQMVDIRLKTE